MDIPLNYFSILVATLVSFFIGWAWYSPLLFMKPWAELSGMTPEKMAAMPKSKMMQSMALNFFAVLITAYVLARFVAYLHIMTLSHALELGFWVWLGFYATMQLGGFLWEGKPFKLYLIQVSQTFVTTLLMAAILGVWR